MLQSYTKQCGEMLCRYTATTVSSDLQLGLPGLSSCILGLKSFYPLRIGFPVQIFLVPMTKSSSEVSCLLLRTQIVRQNTMGSWSWISLSILS